MSRINHRARPWPVDPREYPLSGPTRGDTYCPYAPVPTRINWRRVIFRSVLSLIAVAFCVVVWAAAFDYVFLDY